MLLSLGVGLAGLPAAAQSLHGLTLGAPIPEAMPIADDTAVQAPYTRSVWAALDGVMMTAIADSETGGVVFIELRPAEPGPVATGLGGLTFAETTRADLHARFGSEGIVFEDVGRGGIFGDLAAYFTTYEVADSDTVLSFVTIEPLDAADESSAARSTLDSIVIAQDAYLTEVWGLNRGSLPGYAPIADPFDG
ncbi:hypothetical protein [Gymnodinialimonas ceratoperidinii]|uniref:Uncharacterized protein n=1 Tax=Gymnodinialimonas ceratoperidinii TaxID=2856823 RepID=A0A8F6TU07_9RHOB|nr:hypothetical protein [Gymnodinialimonas ceratoperidinii]QXT38690.1 hypothetical protein KYE46_12175 [Gymnodinialimonas ceratoperidinii]